MIVTRSVWRGISNCSSCSVNQVTVWVCHTTSLSDRILSGCVLWYQHTRMWFVPPALYSWLTVYTTTSVSDGFSPRCRMERVWESHTSLHTLLLSPTSVINLLCFELLIMCIRIMYLWTLVQKFKPSWWPDVPFSSPEVFNACNVHTIYTCIICILCGHIYNFYIYCIILQKFKWKTNLQH